jgi:hypothetical protein
MWQSGTTQEKIENSIFFSKHSAASDALNGTAGSNVL